MRVRVSLLRVRVRLVMRMVGVRIRVRVRVSMVRMLLGSWICLGKSRLRMPHDVHVLVLRNRSVEGKLMSWVRVKVSHLTLNKRLSIHGQVRSHDSA
jgi:hypothetical protein